MKIICNKIICKDKYNSLNFDYKKVLDYQVGTNHHTSLWVLFIKNCNQHHFLRQLEFYNAIQPFQKKETINTLGYVIDGQAKGNAIYMPPSAHD